MGLTIDDIKLENLCAVAEYVRDHAVYSNPGDIAGLEFKKEDYSADLTSSRKFESRYFTSWEQYTILHSEASDAGKTKLQSIEERMFQYLMFLLL